RLCVSEELIQKTLKRVAEETDTKVISFETAKKRKMSPMKYAGVAVAALFVAVLGVNAFHNGGFVMNDVKQEATAELSGNKTDGAVAYDSSETDIITADSADAPGNGWYYSRSGDDSDLEILTDKNIQLEAPEENQAEAPNVETGEGVAEMSASTVELSQMLAGVLKDAGMTPVSDTVECWEFAEAKSDWERELLNCLAAGEVWGNHCPDDGSYHYVLERKGDIPYVMEYNEPLDLIIRIETEKGALWGLLGAGSFFFTESFPQG
ncbi:MAG: hypothetical protein IJ427_05525, partial [Lachnospiraceae bacterium]|nr:hypothetical protein [Lachnospiraceae bacterium]